MNVLDLFSGIGGFSLGLERSGMKTIAFCEKDEFCRKVLNKHWPSIPICDDVKQLKGSEYGRIDVIAGGFPCTQTSVAAAISGNRKGLQGEDSGLWYEYLRIVRTVRALWVIVENPPGIKKWEGEIQNSLERLGYRVSRLEITASDCGLPHLRRRYFYVANLDGKGLEITRKARPSQTSWITRLTTSGGTWLSSAPGTIGVFNGIPDRVDRVRALGNSVVPDKVEIIGRLILEIA